MVINTQRDGHDINIINFQNIHKDTNYSAIYDFYRHKNDWHYDIEKGYNTIGSSETRVLQKEEDIEQ